MQLSEATADFPRLARVLSSRRHFDLVSEADVRHARTQLSLEIGPQLRELIPLAEQAVEREEKVMKQLKNKVSCVASLRFAVGWRAAGE